MNERRHAWSIAREKIQQRMAELRLGVVDLARASGLSEKHVRNLLSNGPEAAAPRAQTRWALCDALQWTPDSIDRILDGFEPIVADDSGDFSRLDVLGARVEELEALQATGLLQYRNQQTEMTKFWTLLQQLRGDLRAVETQLAELRRARGQGDAGPH